MSQGTVGGATSATVGASGRLLGRPRLAGGDAVRAAPPAAAAWQIPDGRRLWQLGLAAVWLLDAVLQAQPDMFSRFFGQQMLAPTALGNPTLVADSITWAAREISVNASLANSLCCAAQLLIALGIAWRPALKAALAASVVWSFGVWWVGEGFGGVLTGRATPLVGAPGAVVVYAVLGVLLWPREASGDAETPAFVAGRSFGAPVARATWAVLWLAMGYLALQAPNRTPDGISHEIARMAVRQPGWLARLDSHLASALAGHGLAAAAVLGGLCVLIALGIFARRRIVRATLLAAAGLALLIWVAGEGFGGTLSGPATDPNSGLLFILLAGTFWPLGKAGGEVAAGAQAGEAVA